MENRLSLHKFDNYQICGELYPIFVKKLQDQNRWSNIFTKAAITEYICFLKIVKVFGKNQTPSQVIDEVWHLHLQFTKDYWENLCPKILGFNLHHTPTFNDSESTKLNNENYEKTLANYKELFGQPPEKIWGSKKSDPSTLTHLLDPIVPSIAFVMILLFIGAPFVTFLPNILGEEFLWRYGILLALWNIITIVGLKFSTSRLFRFLIFISYIFIIVVGTLRISHGVSHHYPISSLCIEIIIGSIIPLFFFAKSDKESNSSCSTNSSSSCGSSGCGAGSGCGGCGGD